MTKSAVYDTLIALSDMVAAERDLTRRAQMIREFTDLVPTLGRQMTGAALYRMREAGVGAQDACDLLGISREQARRLIHDHCERNRLPLPKVMTDRYALDAEVVTAPQVEG